MKKILLTFFLLLAFIGVNSQFSDTVADPREYDEICDRLHYWEDYGGTGEPFAMCSGMPYNCLCPIEVIADA